MICGKYDHDFRHSSVCNICEKPREDRLPESVPEERPRFAGAYECGLRYGGPEEGGWYQTMYHHVASVMLRPDDDAMKAAEELWNAFSDRDDGREITSVLATGAVVILWEDTPGEHATREIARYE